MMALVHVVLVHVYQAWVFFHFRPLITGAWHGSAIAILLFYNIILSIRVYRYTRVHVYTCTRRWSSSVQACSVGSVGLLYRYTCTIVKYQYEYRYLPIWVLKHVPVYSESMGVGTMAMRRGISILVLQYLVTTGSEASED